MAEKPNQIEQHIASTRHQLGDNLHELEDKMKQATDWRTYYERNPMMMVGIAFGGGVMLASILGGKRGASGRSSYGPPPASAGYLTGATQSNPISETWENMKAALIGLSGAKIRSLLNETIPGFNEHYDQAARANNRYSPTQTASQTREPEIPSHRM